jgi:hypothetical protein
MTKIFNPLGRTMQRRDFLKVAGASVAVAALPAAVRAQDPVKLLVWAWLPDFQQQIDLFTASHPGIQVELVNAGQGGPHYAALRSGIQAGSGLDVKLNSALSYRVVNLEYSHSWTKELNGINYQTGLQFTTGLVLHMGTW